MNNNNILRGKTFNLNIIDNKEVDKLVKNKRKKTSNNPYLII